MLTFFKQIFVWWNQTTLGTRIQTILTGKLKGEDSFGNKYYLSKSGKRWVIYKDEIDASKIPNDWYSWMHFTKNKIENVHEFKKYEWQKPHLSNQTGTENAYHPNKNNNEIDKKYKPWKSKNS
jgi:NADH dehydrogenase